MKKIIAFAALAIALPASAQKYTATIPVTCNPNNASDCRTAQTVVNPDGTFIGSGSSGGGGGAATIADGADIAEGATTSTAYTDNTGAAAGTLTGLAKGAYAQQYATRAAVVALSGTVGTQGGAAPTTRQTVQGVDAAGNGRAFLTSATGVLAAPTAAVANSTGTVTAVAASTSTTVCPATTNPVVYEVQIYGTAPVLLGLDGQALSSITPAAGSGAYMLLPTQYTLYVGPVARTNIITAYTATAQMVVCNIVTRQ